MNQLSFISDVIYGLKQEYGERLTVQNLLSEQIDLNTGIKNQSVETFIIPKAIYLPLNLRLSFLKSVGIIKGGSLEDGEREILVDAKDIPVTKTIKNRDYVILDNQKREVIRTEDYKYAKIIIIKEITGHG